MQLDEDAPDVPLLWEMREAALGVIRLTRSVTYEEFCADGQLLDAVERGISTIGRAARLVSPATEAACPELPWRQFAGMARLLGDVDDAMEPEELWSASRRMPAMLRALAGIMPAQDDSG